MASYVRSDIRSHLLDEQRRAKPGQVSVLLAAAIVISIPLEPISTVSLPAGKLSVTWLMIFTAASLADALMTSLLKPAATVTPMSIKAASLAAILLMLPSAMFTSEGAAGYLAYMNFVFGVCAGVRVGAVWAALRLHALNVLDLAMYSFVLMTVVQLVIGFADAGRISALHQHATTPWGTSNYVAGVLVLVGLLIIGRAHLLKRGRSFSYLVAAVGFVAAASTLSRGGVTALAVGVAAALWMLPERKASKFFLRLGALALPAVAWNAVGLIERQRASVNSQVYENVDTRFRLWSSAWNAFQDAPLVGSGWAHFRSISANVEVHSFAHNLFLSYLQIGGLLFGLPLLVIMLTLGVKGARRFRPIGPGLLAAFAITLTDPFTEGTVGGLTVWAAVAFAFTVPQSKPALSDSAAPLGAAITRKRLPVRHI